MLPKKIDIDFLKQKKRELLLGVLGVCIAIGLITFFSSSVSFLALRLSKLTGENQNTSNVVHYNIDGAKKVVAPR